MKFRYWAIIYIALSLLVFDPKLHTGGDNCRYIILAESLVKYGELRDLQFPGEPLHDMYPPGMALLLAPCVAVFGRNIIAMKLLIMLFGLGGFYFYLKIAEAVLYANISNHRNEKQFEMCGLRKETCGMVPSDSNEHKQNVMVRLITELQHLCYSRTRRYPILPAIFFLLVPVLMEFNHWCLSETPYIFFSLGSIWFIIKGVKR